MIKEFEWGEIVVRRQVEEEGEYRRMELPGKYTAKLLYRWDDQRFEEKYLNKLEKNWKKWKKDRQINKSEHLKRAEVIWLHHDVPAAGHGGRWKIVELVTRNYWWPGVTRDVGKNIMEGCDTC